MASQLAGDYASKLLQEDEMRYGRLKDNYSTLLERERAAEEKRRWEAQMAEAKAEAARARAAASAASGYGFGGGDIGISTPAAGGGGGGAGATGKIATEATARINTALARGKDYNSLRSDMLATLDSMKRGNKVDAAKYQMYKQLAASGQIPNIFSAKLVDNGWKSNVKRSVNTYYTQPFKNMLGAWKSVF